MVDSVGESKGHLCPACGDPRGADNTPSCACTQRASDALRDARTAEAAAAEDFDPLRIRPYVDLKGAAGLPDASGTADSLEVPAVPDMPAVPGVPDAETTMVLRPVTPGGAAVGPRASTEDATVTLPAVGATSVLPTPPAPAATNSGPTAPHLFGAADGLGPAVAGEAERPSRRRSRTVLLAFGGAVVSVVAAAGIASGLFSYEPPSRDGASPRDVRAAVPDTSTSAASVSPSTRTTSAAPAFASPSASADESPSPTTSSPSPSPSASASSASPTPSRSAEPTPSPTGTDGDSNSGSDSGSDSGDTFAAGRDSGPVLRRGDRGSEVTEVQQRLHGLFLYNDAIDGNFTTQVEDALRNYQWSRGVGTDNLGVYDHATRAELESETPEP